MSKLYIYPEPDSLQIDESALQIELQSFKNEARKEASLTDLFVVAPAWIPVFFSKFADFHGIPGVAIKASYATLIVIATIVWAINNRHVIRLYHWIRRDDWHEQPFDPVEVVGSIKKKCEGEHPFVMPRLNIREGHRNGRR